MVVCNDEQYMTLREDEVLIQVEPLSFVSMPPCFFFQKYVPLFWLIKELIEGYQNQNMFLLSRGAGGQTRPTESALALPKATGSLENWCPQ